MSTKRPVNLDLRTIKLPITAVASILHRISGLIVFFFIPLFLFGLQKSLHSANGFASVANCIGSPVVKFIVWAFVAALIYHLIAGIRHLFMDMGVGETLQGGRRGAMWVIVLSVILIVLVGWWLW
jgi:succinate dehydrogenase / fumarate reductase cytochrome b subunit